MDVQTIINNSYEKVFDPRILVNDDSKTLWNSKSVDLANQGLREGYKLKESPFNTRIKSAKLRKANLPFDYTEEEIEVIQAVIEDKIFFGNNFAKLKDAEKGWTNITLRSYQEDILNQYTNNRWNILMLPRQSGKTTTTVIEIVHFAISNFDKDIVVIAQSDKVVSEILSKIRECFEGLPFFLQPGFVKFTNEGFELDNGCRCSIGIASESVIQGFSVDMLFIDEFAYISSSLIDTFWANIYPSLVNNPYSKCIIASTPNGRNLFHKMWTNALKKENRFIPYRIYWYDVPGRDEQFKIDTIANVGIMGWEMGFECNFDVGLNSIFGTQTQKYLRNLQNENVDNWTETEIKDFYTIKDFKLNKNDYYLFTVDIAEGLGGDYSILKIIKIIWNIKNQRLEYHTVAMFRSNQISVEDFAAKILDLLYFVNQDNCRVIIENNSYGGELFSHIDNLRMFYTQYKFVKNDVFARFKRTSTNNYERGIRWDKYNKPIAVKSFEKLIVSGQLIETETVTIEEALNFCKNTKTSSFAANYGHDDTVMSLVTLSAFVTSSDLFIIEYLKRVKSELRVILNDEPAEIVLARLKQEKIERQKYFTRYGFVEHTYEEKSKDKDLLFF